MFFASYIVCYKIGSNVDIQAKNSRRGISWALAVIGRSNDSCHANTQKMEGKTRKKIATWEQSSLFCRTAWHAAKQQELFQLISFLTSESWGRYLLMAVVRIDEVNGVREIYNNIFGRFYTMTTFFRSSQPESVCKALRLK